MHDAETQAQHPLFTFEQEFLFHSVLFPNFKGTSFEMLAFVWRQRPDNWEMPPYHSVGSGSLWAPGPDPRLSLIHI